MPPQEVEPWSVRFATCRIQGCPVLCAVRVSARRREYDAARSDDVAYTSECGRSAVQLRSSQPLPPYAGGARPIAPVLDSTVWSYGVAARAVRTPRPHRSRSPVFSAPLSQPYSGYPRRSPSHSLARPQWTASLRVSRSLARTPRRQWLVRPRARKRSSCATSGADRGQRVDDGGAGSGGRRGYRAGAHRTGSGVSLKGYLGRPHLSAILPRSPHI